MKAEENEEMGRIYGKGDHHSVPRRENEREKLCMCDSGFIGSASMGQFGANYPLVVSHLLPAISAKWWTCQP